MSPQGTGVVRLTNDAAGNRAPSYSPSGRKIVLWTNRDGNADIYTTDSDGLKQTRITTQDRRLRSDVLAGWEEDHLRDQA